MQENGRQTSLTIVMQISFLVAGTMVGLSNGVAVKAHGLEYLAGILLGISVGAGAGRILSIMDRVGPNLEPTCQVKPKE